MYPSETFDFAHNGHSFRAFIEQDDDATPPWERYDGMVPVTDWENRDNRPSEVIINDNRIARRFVCVRAAIEQATRDGWGIGDDHLASLTSKLGRAPTKREVIAEAVRLNIEFMRAWCADEWCYIGVCVCLLDENGTPIGDKYASAVWGIESNADDYIHEVARELSGGAIDAARGEMERISKAIGE